MSEKCSLSRRTIQPSGPRIRLNSSHKASPTPGTERCGIALLPALCFCHFRLFLSTCTTIKLIGWLIVQSQLFLLFSPLLCVFDTNRGCNCDVCLRPELCFCSFWLESVHDVDRRPRMSQAVALWCIFRSSKLWNGTGPLPRRRNVD